MSTQIGQYFHEFRVVGINYKKSEASVRGMYAVNQDQYATLLSTAPEYGVSDFFVLSTCNRTEIYGIAESEEQLKSFVSSVCAGDAETFARLCYSKKGTDAIRHLYQVAAGLDSQILGDFEIMGQIKAAVKVAKSNGYIKTFLERLLNSVMQSSKAVKTRTELSGGTVSVSFAAIQYLKEYVVDVRDIRKMKIVLVGTGKIGRVTCKNLVDYLGTRNILLINRTESTAQELASEMGLMSAPLERLGAELRTADIVLVSTNSPEPVVLEEHLKDAGKKLIIDISVPCNVSVGAQRLPDVSFVDVDTLSKIKDETLQKRSAEVPKALAIIEEHVAEFGEWCAMRKHVPVLKEVKSKLLGLPIAAGVFGQVAETANKEERAQKVINSLATKMRTENALGCQYIQAINDFIA